MRGLLALLSPIYNDSGSSVNDLKYIAAERTRNSQLVDDIPTYGRVIVTLVRRYWKHDCAQYIQEENIWERQTCHVRQAEGMIQHALNSFDDDNGNKVID